MWSTPSRTDYPIRARHLDQQLDMSEPARGRMLEVFEAIAKSVGEPLQKCLMVSGPNGCKETLDSAADAFERRV